MSMAPTLAWMKRAMLSCVKLTCSYIDKNSVTCMVLNYVFPVNAWLKEEKYKTKTMEYLAGAVWVAGGGDRGGTIKPLAKEEKRKLKETLGRGKRV